MSDWILTEKDFPENYLNKKHPQDGKISDQRIEPQLFIYKGRLFFRISFSVATNKYIPFTFLCDTSVPGDFYLTKETHDLLKDRINTKDNTFMINGFEPVVNSTQEYNNNVFIINGFEEDLKIKESSPWNPDINVIGNNLLNELGLRLDIINFHEEDIPKFEYLWMHNFF